MNFGPFFVYIFPFDLFSGQLIREYIRYLIWALNMQWKDRCEWRIQYLFLDKLLFKKHLLLKILHELGETCINDVTHTLIFWQTQCRDLYRRHNLRYLIRMWRHLWTSPKHIPKISKITYYNFYLASWEIRLSKDLLLIRFKIRSFVFWVVKMI